MDSAGVCAAIARRHFLRFVYNGSERVAYPCAHGWLTTGNEALRAHEVRLVLGRLRTLPGRLYLLRSMSEVAVTEQPFDDPPRGYRRGDRGMAEIHCQL